MTKQRRVLAADVGAGVATLRAVLRGMASIECVGNMNEAIDLLDPPPDLIVCGIHFDDSRMFDLLRLVKADPKSRSIPFFCFRDLESELAPAILESLDISSRALGAAGFVDLYALKQRFGLERADEEFRSLLVGAIETS